MPSFSSAAAVLPGGSYKYTRGCDAGVDFFQSEPARKTLTQLVETVRPPTTTLPESTYSPVASPGGSAKLTFASQLPK